MQQPAVHREEQVQHFWYSQQWSVAPLLISLSWWSIASYWLQSEYKQRYDLKIGRWCFSFSINGHFVNGNMHIYASCCTQFALQSIHVTIIMRSHWLKSLYCVSTSISHTRCTIRVFWSTNWTLHKISHNTVYILHCALFHNSRTLWRIFWKFLAGTIAAAGWTT